ncbi:MAG: CAP domain-containing protein, partial [Nannocystaceae bacterium]
FEEEVVALSNAARAMGATCGAAGEFPPAPALSMESRLRCAARRHSGAMGEDGFFAHDNPNTGSSPFDRIEDEGYGFAAAGENIAAGYATAQDVVDGWLASDGHCANLMSASFSHIGVGFAYVEGSEYGHYWTQVFGHPLGGG